MIVQTLSQTSHGHNGSETIYKPYSSYLPSQCNSNSTFSDLQSFNLSRFLCILRTTPAWTVLEHVTSLVHNVRIWQGKQIWNTEILIVIPGRWVVRQGERKHLASPIYAVFPSEKNVQAEGNEIDGGNTLNSYNAQSYLPDICSFTSLAGIFVLLWVKFKSISWCCGQPANQVSANDFFPSHFNHKQTVRDAERMRLWLFFRLMDVWIW